MSLTQGVEASADVKLTGKFSVSSAYTYLDARNKTNGAFLPERFKHQGYLKLAYSDEKLGLQANIRASLYSNWKASSQSNRVVQGQLGSEAFQLFDAYAAKTIRKNYAVFASVENIFNNKDASIGKYDTNGQPLPILRPDAGRMFRVGVRVNLSRDK